MAALLFASRATTAFLATCYKHKSLKKSVKQSNGHPRCPLQSPTCVASLEKTSSLNLRQSVGESPRPPLLQVGSRAGAPAVGGGFPALLFRLQGGCTIPPWPRFQPPPRQTQRAAVGIEM